MIIKRADLYITKVPIHIDMLRYDSAYVLDINQIIDPNYPERKTHVVKPQSILYLSERRAPHIPILGRWASFGTRVEVLRNDVGRSEVGELSNWKGVDTYGQTWDSSQRRHIQKPVIDSYAGWYLGLASERWRWPTQQQGME